jgi:hypothetical protein
VSQSLFTTQVPALPDVNEGSPVTVGDTLLFAAAGQVSGARLYAPATLGAGTYTATFWVVTTDDSTGTGTGTLLASAVFGVLTPGAWNNVSFASPVSVDTTHAYVIALRSTEGRYAATGGLFGSAIVNGSITGIKDASAFGSFTKLSNGRFTGGVASYPENTFGSNGYFIDVLYDPTSVEVNLSASLVATGSMSATMVAQRSMSADLAAAGALSATLGAEARLSGALTATGTLAATLAAQASLSANLVAVGSMSPTIGSDSHLSANLTASGGMSATLTVPHVGPVDPIGTPVAQELLSCFTEQLNSLAAPPARIQLRVGQETGPLAGPNFDECCAGLAWIRIASIYPSWDSFPAADNTWLPCGPLAYAVVLEMGVAFCMPWSDSEDSFDNIDPPNAADWATAFDTQMQHQTLMRRAAACCWRSTQRRAVGEWTPLPVEAGCTGGKLLVTVSVPAPCADC